MMSSTLRIEHITYDRARGMVKFPSPSTPEQIATSPLSPYFSEYRSSSTDSPALLPANNQHLSKGTPVSTSSPHLDSVRYKRSFFHPRPPPTPRRRGSNNILWSSSKYQSSSTRDLDQRTPQAEKNSGTSGTSLHDIYAGDYHERSSDRPYKSHLAKESSTRFDAQPLRRDSFSRRYEYPRPSPKPPSSSYNLSMSPESEKNLWRVQSEQRKTSRRKQFSQSVGHIGTKVRGSLETVGYAFSRSKTRSPSSDQSFSCRGVDHNKESKSIDRLYQISDEDLNNEYGGSTTVLYNKNTTKQTQHTEVPLALQPKKVPLAPALISSAIPICSACKKRNAQPSSERCQLCNASFGRREGSTPSKPSSTTADMHGGGFLPSDYSEPRIRSPTPPTPVPKDDGYVPRRPEQPNRRYCSARCRQHGRPRHRVLARHNPPMQTLGAPWNKTHDEDMPEVRVVEAQRRPRVVERDPRVIDACAADLYLPHLAVG